MLKSVNFEFISSTLTFRNNASDPLLLRHSCLCKLGQYFSQQSLHKKRVLTFTQVHSKPTTHNLSPRNSLMVRYPLKYIHIESSSLTHHLARSNHQLLQRQQRQRLGSSGLPLHPKGRPRKRSLHNRCGSREMQESIHHTYI